MTQAQAATASRAIHPAGLKRRAVGRAGSLALSPLLSERRREENRLHPGVATELVCECSIPNCRETIPATADYHRVTADCYIVSPTHLNGDTPIRVADRYVVIRTKTRAASNDPSTG